MLAYEDRARCIRVGDPLIAYRRVAAFMRSRFSFPVIAVGGGSNGKTTTKDMITAALGGESHVTCTPGTNNGWVGVPITLCHPAHRHPAPRAVVLEIGIDEKGAMREHLELARPDSWPSRMT